MLYESLRAAAHVVVYLRRRLPDALFCVLQKLRADRGRGGVEAVVDEISDIDYLSGLHGAEIALYSGTALPQGRPC